MQCIILHSEPAEWLYIHIDLISRLQGMQLQQRKPKTQYSYIDVKCQGAKISNRMAYMPTYLAQFGILAFTLDL